MTKQILELLKASREVIAGCSMPNGAIVASNSAELHFHKEAKNYNFVWPRDASYACVAANMLGLDIHENFFKWCTKAEGWEKTGLFYQYYYADGRKACFQFQPDQTACVLMAIFNYYKHDKKKCMKFEKLIKKSADGLCRIWDKTHFNLVTQDLWEERLCFPDLKDNFTYSLAICSRGLSYANELIPNKKWSKTSDEMKRALLSNFKDYFYRSFGKIDDKQLDASLMGLVWPSRIVNANHEIMKKTISLIEKRLAKNSGIYRYENDVYDGWMYQKTTHRKKGAGYWPLLNFWMSICWMERNNKKKALKYYDKVLGDMKNKKFIPEQIFGNKIQVAVSPLLWSHSMFIIASKKLGYLQ